MLFKVEVLTSLLVCVTSAKSDHFLFANSSRFPRQTTDGLSCLLPYPPPNGDLTILGSEQGIYVPNTLVQQQVIINLSCRKGYLTENGGLARAICLRSSWIPTISQLGGCARTCPQIPLGTDILNVTCTRNNLSINCERPIEGTRAEVTCKPSLEFLAAGSYTICRDGSWDSKTLCQPECGKKQTDLRSSRLRNEEHATTEFPWVALIYKAGDYFCSATIISKRHVLTSAEIFINTAGIVATIEPYIVAVGKVYYNFDDFRDSNIQTSKIAQFFISDFAILVLETPLVFSEYVWPACIDWDNRYESEDLKEDNKGHTIAWGPPNERVYLQNQTVIYKSSCASVLPSKFTKNTPRIEHFCGLVNNSENVCGGMIGAGIVFQNTNSKFYIRGVLHRGYWRSCSTSYVEIYTKVSTYLEGIANVTGRV